MKNCVIPRTKERPSSQRVCSGGVDPPQAVRQESPNLGGGNGKGGTKSRWSPNGTTGG